MNSKIEHIVLITVDGLRGEMVKSEVYPSPNMKCLAKFGVFVDNVEGANPSSTYPSHTTIVTGVKPREHKIFYNSPFTANKYPSLTNWYYDSIKSTTIWEIAKNKGLKTASLFWPVTTNSKHIDINIPEYWSISQVEDQVKFISEYCTPKGIFEEIEISSTGKLSTANFNPNTRNREGRTGYMAAYIIEKYRPNLMTVHFISTDHYQHKFGINSDEAKMALAAVDYGIGQLIEGLQRAGIYNKTMIIITGDHGFVDAHTSIAPNIWLKECGLYSKDPNNWEIMLHPSGSTMFLYQNRLKDSIATAHFLNKLNSLPKDVRSLFRIVSNSELKQLGCDSNVVFALEPINGYAMVSDTSGDAIFKKFGGKHGYLSGIDKTAFIIYKGNGTKLNDPIKPKLEEIFTIIRNTLEM